MSTKVGIYCRLSEEDRNKANPLDDSESIQNQKNMLIKYATEQGWEIYKIYSDDDYCGADRNRPEFNAMLKDAEEGKIDVVLCKTQSRFTRELELVEKYIHTDFPKWGVRFIGLVDNADTNNKGNKKARQINGLINEWYLEDMSDNIRQVLTDRRQNGNFIGAFAPYGYKKDPEQKGHLIIDEEAAAIVREIFQLYAAGYGKTNIARILNARGVPNPTEYKHLHGDRYNISKEPQSKLWAYFSISDILKNEVYIGNLVQGKYGTISYKIRKNKPKPKEEWIRVKDTHEPIIDRDLWNKVQNMIKERAKPMCTGEVGIFARKVRCKECGYTMRNCKSHGLHYLRCPTRFKAKDACIGSFISQKLLDETILRELNKLIDEYYDEDMLDANVHIKNRAEDKLKQLKKLYSSYEKKLQEQREIAKNLYMDKAKGIISEREFLEFSKDFRQSIDDIENQLTNYQAQIDQLKQLQSNETSKKEIIGKYRNLESLNRQIVDELIDVIYVSHKDPETNTQDVQIQWKI